jgi:hypothetical protein
MLTIDEVYDIIEGANDDWVLYDANEDFEVYAKEDGRRYLAVHLSDDGEFGEDIGEVTHWCYVTPRSVTTIDWVPVSTYGRADD